ncbi:unnamed protein product [Adineta steineri]|uniref:fructose-bisphosphate aldolase n=1 Tax=Adineta steineri TaxID=433720 RepID=A0A814Z621_9BILA|nr:unnamed protein product [Adineta steineri]CAF1259572.1 unnamed protein product [Adineta steineri]CAF4161630.1 unnamed protein product [Adineta steineri]CAF4162511.1 unnamed protein product [Adineta steineri]
MIPIRQLYSDHCVKGLEPWFIGMLEADEAYFKEHNIDGYIHHELSTISPSFSVAAAFDDVRLHPELLDKNQEFVKEKFNSRVNKSIFLVFHGDSSSTKDEIKTAIQNSVVKMNIWKEF